MSLVIKSVLRRVDFKLYLYIFCIILPFLLSPLAISEHKETRCGYVILIMAVYWLLEPVPIAVTALLPIIFFPALGIVSSSDICSNYMKESFMMFLGGLIVAVAVEESRLHERLALKVLLTVGTEMKWLMLSFMLTSMFLSMWISNTATTAMMVPIVDAVISEIAKNEDFEMIERGRRASLTKGKQVEVSVVEDNLTKIPKNTEASKHLSTIKTAMLLCICYSSNIGGTGTLTGTTPNLVFKGLVDDLYPDSHAITYTTWMMYNVPGMLLCIFAAWCYMCMIYTRCSKSSQELQSMVGIKPLIMKRYSDLGPISSHEIQVLFWFLILVFLWIFREPNFMKGWVDVIGYDTKIGNSVPSIGISFILFFFPANPRNPTGRPILEWKTTQAKLPWGIILLVGGGLSLADASQKSGLSHLLGTKLTVLSALSPGAIVAVICFMTAMITEIMTNLATVTILLPVVRQMAISIGVNPLFFMLPVSVVCSYAFMLPVATTTNTIVFESGNMRAIDMVKPGLVMNIVCCAIQLLMLNTLGVAMFDLNTFPTWANKSEIFTSTTVTTEFFNYTMTFKN